MACKRKRESCDEDNNREIIQFNYSTTSRLKFNKTLFQFCLQTTDENEIGVLVVEFQQRFGQDDNYESNFLINSCLFMLEHLYNGKHVDVGTICRAISAYKDLVLMLHEIKLAKASSNLFPAKAMIMKFVPPSIVWGKAFYKFLIFNSMTSGYLGFLQFLLLQRKCHGLLYFSENNKLLKILVENFARWRWSALDKTVRDDPNIPQLSVQYQREIEQKVSDDVNIIIYKMRKFNKSDIRRFFIVLWVVDLIYKHQKHEGCKILHDTFSAMIQCFSLMMEITDQPFVAHQDMERFIGLTCENMCNSHKKALCQIWQEHLEKLFPGSKRYYNPRLLQDLTRWKIKECLREDSPLPEQVSELGLPVAVKDFLLLRNKKFGECLKREIALLNGLVSHYKREENL